MDIVYRPEFLRSYNKIGESLQEEIKDKLVLFKNIKNHKSLKVHKLHGRLKGCYSFSVNYRYRIIFEYLNKKTVALITFGDHDIYK